MAGHRLYETYDAGLTKRLEQRLLEIPIESDYSDNSVSVLKKRYFVKDEDGVSQEEVENMLARVAANVAYPDVFYKENDGYETAKTFYEMMLKREFMPNSPTLMNAGRAEQQLSACFVIPIEDSMSSIFKGVYNTAMIHKSGGGTGFSFSDVRRKNHFVTTTYGKASGPISFIRAYDEATNAVNQGGFRRGANMGILKVDHPDIIEFIHAKEEEREKRFMNFNFSVGITDEFMEALEKGQYYYIKNPIDGKLNYLTTKDIERDRNSVKQKLLASEKELNILIEDRKVIAQYPTKKDIRDTVLEAQHIEIGKVDEEGRIMFDARKVFYEIAKLAWKNGEPGVVFLDKLNNYNPTPHIGEIKSTNPCGEQPLLPYEACNLGSINLGLMVKYENGRIVVDYEKIEKTVKNAVHFLDNVIDMSRFPLKEITEMVSGNRKIGLGVMGFADMLFKLGVGYNTEEGLHVAEEIMGFIREKGREKSREMAEKRGVFPNFKGSVYDTGNLEDRLRNATITTIAPTGTISIISQASSGIEPIFDLDYTHKDADGQTRRFPNKEFSVQLKKEGIDPEKVLEELIKGKSLNEIEYIPDNIKKVFVTAMDIPSTWHIKMQTAFQKYTDNAVSKTINLSNKTTVEDVIDAYLLAYRIGCKGVTVYRDGSREEQVLTSSRIKTDKKDLPLGITFEDGFIKALKRPKIVYGQTVEENTGCGNLFVTINKSKVNSSPEERPFEVFATLGKAGGCTQALTEAVGRLISYALRIGGHPKAIIGQLSQISCPKPFGFGPNSTTSCMDGISKAMAEVYGINPKRDGHLPFDSANFDNIPIDAEKGNGRSLNMISGACPECGSPLQQKEGCMGGICVDPTCAFSTCS